MAQRDDGGTFENPFARLLANKMGGSMSLDDLNDMDKQRQDALNTASGVVGSVGTVPSAGLSALQKIAAGAGEDAAQTAAPSMSDAIKAAAARSNVKQVPTFQQAADEQIIAPFKNGPKDFFDKATQKAAQNGVSASSMDQAAMQQQAAARDLAIKIRNENQLKAAKDIDAQKWKQLFGGSGS